MSALTADRRIQTGIAGLDDILGGGLTANRMYLIEGTPGAGKTTLALQFLLDGAAQGESGLYITLSETADELRAIASSHGWTLDDLNIFELVNIDGLSPDSEQSILHPSEIELGETVRGVMNRVDAVKPSRVVFDSLSEMRLLAQNPLRYRRQIMALKHFFSTRDCTVLLLDDQTAEQGDAHLHSLCHGVIMLEQRLQDFGAQRRRLHVVKMRGIKFRGGYHDFMLDTGGIQVFQRLVAADHHANYSLEPVPTGSAALDALLGGGLARGTNLLLNGPAGVGKTSTAVRCMLSALQRGERAAYYLFDEGITTLIRRSRALGMDIEYYIEAGALEIQQIDPAELSPGEFSSNVRAAIDNGARFVVVDSLNAYLQAMPGENFLILQMHELMSYLNQMGVLTLMILGQHGLVGDMRSDVDLSYLSDSILLYRFFEARGEVRRAISVVKSRTFAHENRIREFGLGPDGLEIGEPLFEFEGVLSGMPNYRGDPDRLAALRQGSAGDR